jgi:uncharacterized Zn finger protein (UPF0148 family)
MVRCSGCGLRNEEGEVFCASCNLFLEWAAESDQSPKPEQMEEPRTEPATEPAPRPAPQPVESGQLIQQVGMQRIIEAIDQGRSLATGRERPDLAEHLDKARAHLDQESVTVVVVGEFKGGKSTLINALLQTAVCPVDADIVTGVPTLVSYAEQSGVTAYAQSPDGGEVIAREASLREIAALVSEPVDPNAHARQRSVEVRLPHRMLKAGLRLVDTPGVGGLESAHGQLSLGSLAMADGVLFVTDASQELTGPELSFLRTAVARCPSAALVVTKTDLYVEWRRIAEINQGHLRDAGLDLPVIPVSSFLRLRAATDSSLNTEAGFEQLVRFLATGIVAPGVARATASAAQEVDFAVAQLAQETAAERIVLARPEEGQAVVQKLDQARKRTASLSGSSATWQQTLADGVQDLVADVEHDLQGRLRALLSEIDAVVDQSDPKDSWADTEAWVRRQVATVAVANRDLLTARAEQLTEDVAAQFDLEAGTGVELTLRDVGEALSGVSLPTAASLSMQTGRLGSLMVAGRTTMYLPIMLISLGNVFGLIVYAAGAAVVLGAGIGQKLVKDEVKRQRMYRQQQAKAATRRFVDEVAFLMNKETRDGLRLTQRQLRDDFQARATAMHRSAQAALEAAQRVGRLDRSQASARAVALDVEAEQLASVRSHARSLVVAGAATAAAVGAASGVAELIGADDD